MRYAKLSPYITITEARTEHPTVIFRITPDDVDNEQHFNKKTIICFV